MLFIDINYTICVCVSKVGWGLCIRPSFEGELIHSTFQTHQCSRLTGVFVSVSVALLWHCVDTHCHCKSWCVFTHTHKHTALYISSSASASSTFCLWKQTLVNKHLRKRSSLMSHLFSKKWVIVIAMLSVAVLLNDYINNLDHTLSIFIGFATHTQLGILIRFCVIFLELSLFWSKY